MARATAERYGLAYIDLGEFEVDRSAAALIRPSAAKRYQAVPVGFVGGGLLVAMTDPADSLAVNDIAVMTKLDVQPAATTRSALDALLAELAAAGETVAAPSADAARPEQSSAVFWQADGAEGAPAPTPGAAATSVSGADAERTKAELEELRRKLA
jgi:type IV pilus assembly protein PilB